MATNYWGQLVKFFGHNGLEFKDGVSIQSLAADPTMTATAGKMSSIGLFGANVYVKLDDVLSISWIKLCTITELMDHITDTVDAHDASAISSTNPLGVNVEAVLTALNNYKDSGLQGAYDEFRQITLSSGNTIKVLNDSSDTNTFLTTFTNHDESVAHFGIGKDKTLIGKEIQFNNVSTGAKISHTTRENITVTDTMGTELLRKQTNILYIQDFKDTFPISYFTEAASMTKVNEADTTYASNTVARINQTGAVALEYVDSEPIVLTGADWYLEPIKLEVMQSKTGVGTWFMYLMTSTDGVTYTASQSSIEVGDKKNDKFITQLASDITHIKVRWVIGVADNATVLRIGRVLVNAKAFEVGQITLKQHFTATTTVAGGNVTAIAKLSGSQNLLFTEPVIVSGDIEFTTLKKSLFTILPSIKATNNLAFSEIFVGGVSRGSLNNVVSTQDPALGGGLVEEIEAGVLIRVALGNQDSTSTNPFSISATAYADNVIVDAATSGLNTVNAGALTISATTTAPTKGTVVTDKVWVVYNANDTATIRFEYHQSTAGTAGSGDYLFKMPSGMEIDVTKVTPYTTVEGMGGSLVPNTVGNFIASYSIDTIEGSVVVYDKDFVRFAGNHEAGEGYVGASYIGLNLAGTYSATFTVPIKGRRVDSLPVMLDVSSERENVYSARIANNGTATIVSQSSPFIESVTRTGVGVVVVTFKSGFSPATLPSLVGSVYTGAGDYSLEFTAYSSTGFTFRTFNASGIPSDQGVSIVLQRQGADYRPPQAYIADSVALTEANTAGIEYRTNEKVDGKWVYARTFVLNSNITTTTTIATIETNLKPINSSKAAATIWLLDHPTYATEGADTAIARYNSATGVVEYLVIGRTVYSGTNIVFKYLKD